MADEAIIVEFLNYFSLERPQRRLEDACRQYPEEKSFEVDLNDLAKLSTYPEGGGEFVERLTQNPDSFRTAAEAAVSRLKMRSPSDEEYWPHIRFFNLPDTKHTKPMALDIGAPHLDRLVSIDGVISSISEIKPRIKEAKWLCLNPSCGGIVTTFPDKTTPVVGPMQCNDCGKTAFKLLEKDSLFVNMQRASLQDPVEKLRGNTPAVHIDLWLEEDLVNRVAPGDKVVVTGVLRLKPVIQGKGRSSVYAKFFDIFHLRELEIEFEELEVTREEEEEIIALARDPKLYEKIIGSIAPSIYGYNELKQAIALQLFGGTPGKIMPDGERMRSDIHCIMVGDPGVGKSTILEYVAELAPKAVMVSGGSASGVGLCVAPDSLILNDSGFKKISDFVEGNWDGNAREELPGAYAQQFAEKAWTLGSDLKIRQENVSKIWRIRAPPEMVKVTTRMGRQISLTPATSLIVLDKVPAWRKATDLTRGTFVATARTLPQGNSFTPAIRLLANCPNLFLDANFNGIYRKITDKLATKHGSLRIMAKAYGIAECTVYDNRSQKRWSNMKLADLMKMAKDAQMEGELEQELVGKAKKVFIRYGCFTKIPRRLEDERLAYLAGLLMGDGDCSKTKNQANLRFSNTNQTLLRKFKHLVKQIFGINARTEKKSWRIPSIRFSSVPAFLLLKEFGLDPKKTNLSISHAASCMPGEVLAKLLQGLFDTDGYVAASKTGSVHIGISTVSPMLAKTIQLSLLKFGIISKLRVRPKAGTIAVGKTITVKSLHDAHVVEIRGVENFKAFAQAIGFSHPAKTAKLSKIISSARPNTNIDIVPVDNKLLSGLEWGYRTGKVRPSREMLCRAAEKTHDDLLLKLSRSDVFWDEITSVERFAPQFEWVYDFTVDNSHNFICNGFFTHNTASAERDELTEGWVLKAGAMVLANGGIICLDEADKMDEEDRGAMHQAMEQQKINVAKAGIVTEFQTRCSVLAGANPKLGRFDPNTPIAQQFALSPPLLSRFDLIFTMRDVLDEARDKKMAQHIMTGHIYASTKGEKAKKEEKAKQDASKEGKEKEASIIPVIRTELLRKYIAYARKNIAPQMTPEAGDKIRDYYVELRKMGKEGNTFPVTARQIEGLIRLSEASAKARLSPMVDVQDAQRAIDLANFVLKEVYMDKETGKLDSDLISLGQSKTRLDKQRTVMQLIETMEKEVDLLSADDVVREALNHGIDENYARTIIEERKRMGDLYEPKPGYLRSARKKMG